MQGSPAYLPVIWCLINPVLASAFLIEKICSLLFITQRIENQASLREIKMEPTPQFKFLESPPKCCLQISPTQLLCTGTAEPLPKMIQLDSTKPSVTPHLLGHHGTVSPSYYSLIFTFAGKCRSNETASHQRSVMEKIFLQHSLKTNKQTKTTNFNLPTFQK